MNYTEFVLEGSYLIARKNGSSKYTSEIGDLRMIFT